MFEHSGYFCNCLINPTNKGSINGSLKTIEYNTTVIFFSNEMKDMELSATWTNGRILEQEKDFP